MKNIRETIVVGGGMAGIACSIKLKEAGRDVMLLTETLGGKTCYDKHLDMNFGAVFYMENYNNVKQILEAGPLLLSSYSQVMCHLSDKEFFPALSLRMLGSIPQLLKFKSFMKKFMTHYATYKKNCEVMTVKDALERDLFIKSLYFKSADELISELKIKKASRDLVSLFVFGCTGTDVKGLNALDFCNCAQGLVIPIYKFSLNHPKVEKRIGDVVYDCITEMIKNPDSTYTLTTSKGSTYSCKNLVLATPAVLTKELLGLPEIRESSQLISYLVGGIPKKKYKKHDVHVFADTIPLIFLYHRQNGRSEYEVFSVNEIDMGDYFDTYKVIDKRVWPNALYVKGDVIMDQDLGDGLYTAGDHNGLGMEPAAISGIFAANKILES